MELCCNLPYPTLTDIREDGSALRILSPAYAGRNGELTAVLQYVYQSVCLNACGKGEEASTLLSIAVNEMHHLELLGTVLTKLGASPIFTSCPPYPVGFYSASNVNYTKNYRAMLCADIAAEETSITEYTQMLPRLRGNVFEVISRIIEDERVHLKKLTELLNAL